VIYGVLMTVNIQTVFFWVVTLYTLTSDYQLSKEHAASFFMFLQNVGYHKLEYKVSQLSRPHLEYQLLLYIEPSNHHQYILTFYNTSSLS
jgi:hypothetical protein